MKKSIKFLPIYLLISHSTFAFAFAFEQVEVEVVAGSQHEECFYINNEISINYEYKTDSPLDFNLHYHDDNGMNFLVELPKSTANKKSVAQLKNKQVYCLMWSNSTLKNAVLNYEFTMEK